VRRAHPLRARHRALTLRATGTAATAQSTAEDVPQLPEQHQRQLHRKHERDQPRKRRGDMTR
jgi:hypothetical protein